MVTVVGNGTATRVQIQDEKGMNPIILSRAMDK